MIIRKAKKEDTPNIAYYMMLAMEDIVYEFIGEKSEEKATRFLENLIAREGDQYSYENCWVAEIDGETVGAAVVYDGGKLYELRDPVIQEIKRITGRDYCPEDETQAGEFYIDCVGVSPNHQGKGIGSKIFQFLIDEYVHNRRESLGLLVDKDNFGAKKLYLKLGFEVVGEQTLAGKLMEHLQYQSMNASMK
jgi:ribosomal protein S18 acetylase RimI-like enzyme